MNTPNKAFSLVEILVATAVIAVGLLAVFASMAFGVRANRHGELTTQATNLNREVVDLIRGKGYAFSKIYFHDAPAARLRIDAPPFQDELAAHHDGPFRRNVQLGTVGAAGWEANIATIKVTIYWQQGATEHHVTYETYDRP